MTFSECSRCDVRLAFVDSLLHSDDRVVPLVFVRETEEESESACLKCEQENLYEPFAEDLVGLDLVFRGK